MTDIEYARLQDDGCPNCPEHTLLPIYWVVVRYAATVNWDFVDTVISNHVSRSFDKQTAIIRRLLLLPT